MAQDLNFIVLWCLFIGFFGLASLPLTLKLFSKFWDFGYIFSKTIGILLVAYSVFTLSIFKLLPFSQYSILGLLMLWGGFNWLYIYKRDKTLEKSLRDNYRSFLVFELIFFAILAFWSWVRAHQPDIEGLEKFMDWGFVNSILRTTYMPPTDMWYAGQPINYYYFGQLIFAMLTKVSGINSAITYNLAIATCAAFAFTSTLSISSNLARLANPSKNKFFTAGLISALLLTFGANLQPAYKIAKLYNEKHDIKKAIDSYWYPDATRFIGFDPDTKDKTIHEFAAYSFIVADLHGHMNDIAVVLLIVAILSHSFVFSPESKLKKEKLFSWPLLLPLGLLLSIAYMTNAWDFAIYSLLFGVAFFIHSLGHLSSFEAIKKTIANGLALMFIRYIFNIPFALNFTPMVEGVRLADMHSPFYQLFILYGGHWLILLPILVLLILNRKKFSPVNLFFISVVLTATLLIIIPEIIYLKDIYVFDHRRANTMFKLVYEATMLYTLTFGYALLASSEIKNKIFFIIYRLIFLIVFILTLSYQYFGLKGYYGIPGKEYLGLYGLNFIDKKYPDNYLAIKWLQRLPGQPNIVEAAGDSYTDFNQISMATGLPTIQGWVVHEWLWRGGYDKPAARQVEVQKIYESSDINEVRSLLQKYDVSYIIVGPKEIEKYKDLNLDNFNRLGFKEVFFSGATKIFQVK